MHGNSSGNRAWQVFSVTGLPRQAARPRYNQRSIVEAIKQIPETVLDSEKIAKAGRKR
jgi:hypothetical protein